VPETEGFIEFAVELLGRVGPVRARSMFGGHGLYCGGVMIGLVDDDEIFLKTDAATRSRFEEAGCRQWVFVGGGKEMRSSYFRPPDEAHESPEDMEPWARLAVEAARRADAAKRARKPGKPKARKATAKGTRARTRRAGR
jgi:DNA transformation protein and related proteins